MNTVIKALTILLLSVSVLAACGGGGSDGGTPQPPTGSSNWDSMVWDQDNWQ